MKVRWYYFVISFLSIVASASNSMAQGILDGEEQSNSAYPYLEISQRPEWNAAIVSTWLGGSKMDESSGELSMREAKVVLHRRYRATSQMVFITGIHYSVLDIGAPKAARLPETLHAISVSFGGDYRLSDKMGLALTISPGFRSDFKSIGTEDLRVPVTLRGRYHISKELTLLGGIRYLGGNRDLGTNRTSQIMPLIGIQYKPSEEWSLTLGLPFIDITYKPSELWVFSLGFPRTAITFKPKKGTEYFIKGELTGGGVYSIHDSSIGTDSISYRDYRASTGVDYLLFSVVRLGVSGGYSFARKLEFDDRDRSNLNLAGTPFARIEAKFSW